jgi:hypothetical protein
MGKAWRLVLAAALVFGVCVGVVRAQVELDRILARVGARVITKSDVHQAQQLKLVDDVSSEAAVQRALEERWLVLEEIRRGPPLSPGSDDTLAARRADWERKVGGKAAAAELLAKSSMSEAALEGWLRDDLRIEAYLARQFATVPASDRPKASTDWLNRLRQRAR